MDRLKVIIYILLIYLAYKLFFSKEGFALTAGKVFDDPTKIDLNKYYTVGKRTTSNTVTPSKNGGKECAEYREIAYQLAPAQDAVCKGEIQDSYYSFGADSKLGIQMFPFNVQSVKSPGQFWHPKGGAATPGDNTQIVWFQGGSESPKNKFTMDDNGVIRHGGSTDLCLGIAPGTDLLYLGKQFCDGNHQWQVLADNTLRHKKTGQCTYAENNDYSNKSVKVGGCGDPNWTTSYKFSYLA
jgi:hypothetical protein